MKDLDSKSDLDMTEVRPPVPPATCEVPAAESGAGAAGVRKATPRHHRSPPREPISVASSAVVAAAAAATITVPAVAAVTATTAGTFLRSWGDLHGTWRFSASAPRTEKRTYEFPVTELDHERVLRGCPVGICNEDRGSQEDLVGEGRGNRTSSRFTAGRAPREGT